MEHVAGCETIGGQVGDGRVGRQLFSQLANDTVVNGKLLGHWIFVHPDQVVQCAVPHGDQVQVGRRCFGVVLLHSRLH